MRIDIVSIFPDIFKMLDLSLLGKAKDSGLLDIRTHDLRDYTFDSHRTVDDTPYGGGAGMVMKPEPWGLALEDVLADACADERIVLIFTTPAGEVFKQAVAHELAEVDRIIFACGRYEGIDQRVIQHYSTDSRVELRQVSIGDYVLNGGEIAAAVMIEAIGRLIPGVVGNPESLVEESHESGLLEYPSYTKPRRWQGLDVPEILLSGNHAAIANWRNEQQVLRTAQVRPDLLAENTSADIAK